MNKGSGRWQMTFRRPDCKRSRRIENNKEEEAGASKGASESAVALCTTGGGAVTGARTAPVGGGLHVSAVLWSCSGTSHRPDSDSSPERSPTSEFSRCCRLRHRLCSACLCASVAGWGGTASSCQSDIPPVSKLTQPPSINSLNFYGCHGNTIRGLSNSC